MKTKISVVCLGGGTGQSTLLSALKQNPAFELTAIVSMFDNGGSSGVLRDRLGVLPPSDLQRCMAALSPYPYVRDILNERIEVGAPPHHTGGNLLMAALEKEYGRRDAVSVLAKMFRVQGNVLPVSYDDGHLRARFTDGTEAEDEVAVDDGIKAGKTIVSLDLSSHPEPSSEVLEAIVHANVIIIGPGSLYTSIAPNFLVSEVRGAIDHSSAKMLWVMNLLAEGMQFSQDAWVMSVIAHWRDCLAMNRQADCIIVNSEIPDEVPVHSFAAEHKYSITLADGTGDESSLYEVPLWKEPTLARHDVDELARALSIIIPQLVQ